MTSPFSYDVVVIGAGAAGLAAAARLAAANRRVLVLEARERIGGRVWTRHEPGLGVPLEFGAEFIHGHAFETLKWLKQAGKGVIENPDTHWRLQRGALRKQDRLFKGIQKILRRHQDAVTHELSLEAFLKTKLARELSNEQRDYVRMMAQGFDAADPARISARSIVEEWTSEALTEAPQSRPEGGYTSLLTALAAALADDKVRIQLQSVAQKVEWQPGAVTISGTHLGRPFTVKATQCIVALPLGVLQAAKGPGAVRFSAPLKKKREALKEGLAFGPVIKVLLKFRHPFWDELEDGRYRDAAFLHAPGHEFPTFWTPLPLRAPLLIAWAGGPEAAKLSALGDTDKVVDRALRTLKIMFSGKTDPAEHLDAAYLHDWQRDPFARGAYSYITAGGGTAREALAEPVEKTLFFAGEATDTTGEAATVTGALLSGARAAQEALRT